MEGGEKPPAPDLPSQGTAMKLKDIILLVVAALAVLSVFYCIVVVAAFASREIAPWAGVLLIVASCIVALLMTAIIKKESDGEDRD